MFLPYSILMFLILSFICYNLLTFLKIKTIISNITLAIIISSIFSKIIINKFDHSQEKRNTTQEQKLNIGLSPDYPPYAFIKDNKLVGLDIDLLELIAKKLNLNLEFHSMPFHSILVSLQLNNIDIAASGLTGSEERKKEMLVSNPYFEDQLCAISLKKNGYNTLESIKNKKIIINTGYTSGQYVEQTNLSQNTIKLKSVPDALIALSLNQGDVFITSKGSILQFLETSEAENYFIFDITNNPYEEAVSFLLNKNNNSLLAKINTAIQEIISDGTMKKLLHKWELR